MIEKLHRKISEWTEYLRAGEKSAGSAKEI